VAPGYKTKEPKRRIIMGTHFDSHTPEAMRNFVGELQNFTGELQTEVRRRTDYVRDMLTKFRDGQHQVAADLRQQAKNDGEARRQFVGQLKSLVHQLRSDFNQEHSKIAASLKAASEIWKNRKTRRAEFFTKSYQQPDESSEPEAESSPKFKKSKSKKSRG
jgi:predicted phage tail protein